MRERPTGVHLYVPAAFDANDLPQLAGLANEAHYVLHRIISLHNTYRHGDGDFVPVSRQTWETFIHPKDVTKVLRALLHAKVIETDGNYLPQKHDPHGIGKSLGYKLAEPYWKEIKRVEVTKRSLAAKIKRHRLNYHNQPIEEEDLHDVEQYLLKWLGRTSINLEEAYQSLTQTDSKLERRESACRMTIDQIYHQELDFTVCPYGRIHTPITRLLSEARSHLLIDGKKVEGVDVRNSQVVFLAILLLDHSYTNVEASSSHSDSCVLSCASGENQPCTFPPSLHSATNGPLKSPIPQELQKQAEGEEDESARVHDGDAGLPEDIARWVDLTMRGRIYDHLMEQTGETNRKAFKHAFFRDVLYGDPQAYYVRHSHLTRLVQDQFPNVYRFISDKKAKNYRTLAREMQVRESRFMIGQVCTRLMKHHADIPILTIHDSILTTPEHLPTVHRIIMEEFLRIGIEPSLA